MWRTALNSSCVETEVWDSCIQSTVVEAGTCIQSVTFYVTWSKDLWTRVLYLDDITWTDLLYYAAVEFMTFF